MIYTELARYTLKVKRELYDAFWGLSPNMSKMTTKGVKLCS